ncbi:MAG: adenylate/guanylate cyclase domain-containing protein [Actinomycetota bacterium]|nr:adenylate/guanylate cyclase domain-containing protein [Actinomycetota bacterium]
MQCPACQAEVVDGARFCSACGHELARRADERRVVTVLFADIVGFTGLSEDRDPEQVKNLVDSCFARLADDITSFGGRVDKVVGDAIVALFGAPIAHEDDAERAVRAALRMQETVGRLDVDDGVGIRLRIGINTGEVLVGAMTAGDDYTAMGDVVNTASRLQTAAEPGTVLVGPITHEATQEFIRYRSVGQLHARGREAPVTAYRALAPYGRPGERRASAELPFVGRERELDLVTLAITNAYETRRGLLLGITGEAGVGKSRIAGEIADLARFDHDAVVLHGRCLPYGETNIWWPIAGLIRSAIALDESAESDDARTAVAEMVERTLGDRAELLDAPRVTDGIMHVLGYDTHLSRLAPDRVVAEVIRSTRILLGMLSRTTSLVIWLSDLEFADDAVFALLEHLIDRLGRRPVVMMVTGMPKLFERWSPATGRFTLLGMALDGLDEEAMRLLAAEVAGSLDPATRAALVERASGNPLFLEEMARTLAATDGTDADNLPANVRSVIGARLDALDELARTVIGNAAVLGRRGDREWLQTFADVTMGGVDVTGAVAELSRADLLELTTKTWEFHSDLVRDVVYDRLTKTQRAQSHAGVAEWLASSRSDDVDTVAWHYRQAASLQEAVGGVDVLHQDVASLAVDWTLRTLDEPRVRSSVERSIELQTEALALLEPTDLRRADLLLRRADVRLRGLALEAARADLDEATALLGDGGALGPRFRCELVASELAQWSDDHDEALARASAALELARADGDPRLIADALRRRGMTHIFQGEHQAAEASVRESFAAYEAAGDEIGMAWARQNLAWIAFTEGRMVDAEERLLAASEAFERAGDLAGKGWSTGLLAYVRIYDGRFTEADELARQTLLDAREQGDRWTQGMMNVALGTSALWSGRIDDALGHAESAIANFPEGADSVGVVQALATRGRALVRRGRLDPGFQLLVSAEADHPFGPPNDMLRTSIAAASVTVGDAARAQQYLDGFDEIDIDIVGGSERHVALGLARLQEGDADAAFELLDALPGVADDTSSRWGWAVTALARAATGRSVEAYADAVETSGRSTYSDRVLARLAGACAAARAGDSAGAAVALDRARAAVPTGGDQVFPTIVAVAAAVVAEKLTLPELPERRAEAESALTRLGLPDSGWWAALRAAAGVEPARAEHPSG